jgi:hypothetical protein
MKECGCHIESSQGSKAFTFRYLVSFKHMLLFECVSQSSCVINLTSTATVWRGGTVRDDEAKRALASGMD